VQRAIIFGTSILAKVAFSLLQNQFEIIYFCGPDKELHGTSLYDKLIISPEHLDAVKGTDVKVVIACENANEIAEMFEQIGIRNYHIFGFQLSNTGSLNSLKRDLGIKKVNLGSFLASLNNTLLINNTFMAGGSTYLDYIFIKSLAVKFNLKTYLEIGTWMGESIAQVSEVVEQCYSISLPDNDPSLVSYFESINEKNNFSRYFSKQRTNIKHYYEDSKTFDFNEIPGDIDLVFIDGDHSYDGVRCDTENVFRRIDPKKTIVVWHDFKEIRNNYIMTTVNGVYDALPEQLHKNLFAVDNNMCGIYIPDRFINQFNFEQSANEIYSYQTSLVKVIKNELPIS